MNKEFKKGSALTTISKDTREVLLDIATLLIGIAISGVKFFFATYPFGLAFCCACKKRTPFAVAGASIGALLQIDNFVPYLIAYLSLIAIRLVGSVWLSDDGERRISLGEGSRPAFLELLFCERASVRVGICALCELGLGVFRVISGGFTYYDIFVTVFSVTFVSILCYALCGKFDLSEISNNAIGIGALLFVFVFAIRGREIFSLDLSIILSYGAVLFASWRLKGAHSVALGILLGICHGALFAPVFALGALVSSLLLPFSLAFSMVGALVIGLGYGILVSGYEAIVYLLPEILFASLVMYPLNRFDILPVPSFVQKSNTTSSDALNTIRKSELKSALSKISSSFDKVSSALSTLSAKAKSPDRDFYNDMCLETLEKHCFSCPKRSICWEKDTSTTRDNISKMANECFTSKSLSLGAVDEKFLHRCPNIEKVTDEINKMKRDFVSSGIKNDKLEVSAQDFEVLSKFIEHLSAELDEIYTPSKGASEKISRACVDIGLIFDKAEVFSGERYSIVLSGVNTTNSKCSLDDVRLAFENVLGVPLTQPELFEESGTLFLRVRSAPSIGATHFTGVSPLISSDENGDTVCSFLTDNDKFYMILCDGMGSGKEAKVTSSICTEFLKSTLCSSQSKELCLTMLNNLIRAKSLECSSSVDLLEIDLVSRGANLTKSGAAPSFIKRGQSVFRLHSKTAPVGIMKSLDAERLDFNLRPGDIIVMISDGIASDESDSKYLVDFLSSVEIADDEEIIDTGLTNSTETELLSPVNKISQISPFSAPKKVSSQETRDKIPLSSLPDAIISLAKNRLSLKPDDMSVCVTRINEK